MLKTNITIIFVCFAFIGNAQVKVEAQTCGSNFLGMSLNVGTELAFWKNLNHQIEPVFGLGYQLPGWDIPTVIVHGGLAYLYRQHWGVGMELSYFVTSPFYDPDQYPFVRPSVAMILYPNAGYTYTFKEHWYVKLSGGVWLAFGNYIRMRDQKVMLHYEGDPLPGGGLSFGYRF
jgi:hypothetical protein